MRIITSAEQRHMEQLASSSGFSAESLTRHAGKKIFEYLDHTFHVFGKGAVLLCGKGGNGADGFVCAVHLLAAGAWPVIVLCNGSPNEGISAHLFHEAVQKGIPVLHAETQEDAVLALIRQADFIVDAVFGIGFNGHLPRRVATLFSAVHAAERPVISVDLPSGLHADSGYADPYTVKATATLCLLHRKPAHLLRSAAKYLGQILTVDMNLPPEIEKNTKRSIYHLTGELLCNKLPARAQNTHKYHFGSLVCVVGTSQYRGAAVLCAKGALAGGAGLLQVVSETSVLNAVSAHCPEAILLDIQGDVDETTRAIERASAGVVGCGLTDDWATDRTVSWVLTSLRGTAVIDAGALDTVKRSLLMLKERKSATIITPHIGEFARMVQKESAHVYANRLHYARSFSEEYGVITVLKSDNTVIALPSGEVYVNTAGNSGLSKGGSGDLLCGLIGSLCASGIQAADSALLGVYLHAFAADLAARATPQRSMTPSLVAAYLPKALSRLERLSL